MALFDRLGAWWEARTVAATEQKASFTIDDFRAVLTVNTLVHGPGATDLLGGYRRGADGNSAVYACLGALAAGFIEAPARVVLREGPESITEQPDHPLQRLLDHPNDWMSPLELWAWVLWAQHVDGNAYVRKIRAGGPSANVVQLWPISPTRIELRSTPERFIDVYRYHLRPGKYEDIRAEDMLHFRLGLDDSDHRRGCAPLKRLVREVASDAQATLWTERLLGNMAVPGLMAQVKNPLSQQQAEELKAKIAFTFGAENLGKVGVLDNEATLAQFGFNPEQMKLDALHRVPEERISAVLRVPAIVAGLGAGLDRATYANARQLRELFTEQTLLPLWAMNAAKLQTQLVPEFTRDRRIVAEFDTSNVRALQEDEDAKYLRLNTAVQGGWVTVNEARSDVGFDPVADGDVFLIPVGNVPTPVGELAAPVVVPAPLALPSGGKNWIRMPDGSKHFVTVPGGYLREVAPDTKARGLSVPFARLRQQIAPPLTRDLVAFLQGQRDAAIAALTAGEASRTALRKAIEDLVPPSDSEELRVLLNEWYGEILQGTTTAIHASLGVQFALGDDVVAQYLRTAGSRITSINETTRQAVRDALMAGTREGEGIPALAKRLREMPEFGRSRAVTIARTELGSSQIGASVTGYKASGVVAGIKILDGDYDEECAARNGRILSLAASVAEPPLLHPRCTAAWLPVTDAAEVEGAA